MEYFGGILFLTTNRVDTFDRALRSRIHLAIYYPPLDVASRAEIWKACISRCDGRVETEVLEDSAIELLSHENLNGREIRNVVHMANALAATQERPIREQDFTQALSAMRTFNTHKGEVQDNGSGRADESSTQRSSKKRRIT
ncbi:hypothetical protein RRF57_009702 [Xylaria bambusicola]|uniref:AAA+ ATPase lid domain-containing protein n=1 Tax=Xylaria bambusicola TaxID=326684 RepID=A0AAN7UR12_9PEZI